MTEKKILRQPKTGEFLFILVLLSCAFDIAIQIKKKSKAKIQESRIFMIF